MDLCKLLSSKQTRLYFCTIKTISVHIYTVTVVHGNLLKALGNHKTFHPSFLHNKRFACSSQTLFILVSLNKDLLEYMHLTKIDDSSNLFQGSLSIFHYINFVCMFTNNFCACNRYSWVHNSGTGLISSKFS